MFTKGQKVVCINDDIYTGNIENHNEKFPNWIVKDEIYTIRACTNTERGWGVLVEELKNPAKHIDGYFGKAEGRFRGERFAPLDVILDSITLEEIEDIEEPAEV